MFVKKIVIMGLLTFISGEINHHYNTLDNVLKEIMAKHNFGLGIVEIVLLISLGIIISLYTTGFSIKTLNKYINSDANEMAELGDKNLLILGLKFSLGSMAYLFVSLIPTFILSGFYLLLVTNKYVLSTIFHNSLLSYFVGILLFLLFILAIVCVVFILIQFIIMTTYYSIDLKIRRIFAYKTHFKILKENLSKYGLLLGKTIVLVFIAILINIISRNFIALLLVATILGTYLDYAQNHLFAQFGKEICIKRYCKVNTED